MKPPAERRQTTMIGPSGRLYKAKTYTGNGVIPKPLPSQELLQRLLRYDPETGYLYHLERDLELFDGNVGAWITWNKRFSGERAFTEKSANGYLRGNIFSDRFQAHRIIWKMIHGVDPNQIDHINGVRGDNRLVNIRSVTHVENSRNRYLGRINSTGCYGIYYNQEKQHWTATIWLYEEQIHLGHYKEKIHAIIARKAAERVLKFSERHGEILKGATK